MATKSKPRQKNIRAAFETSSLDSSAVEIKSTKHRQKRADNTFETSSIDYTAVEEKLFGHVEEDEDSDDGPVVFICGKCRLPVGDSLAWDGSEDGQNQIKLKRVTENVLVGEDTRLYDAGKKTLCLIKDLFCQGCHSLLGMVYASTPKHLDHKRFAFCFNVAEIDSYVLGSASQMLAAEGPKEQLVTAEYRGIVEQQLKEMKMLVLSMAQTMEEIETGLQDRCDEV
ncbi:protein Mis18-alpha isoform X2 [Seriola lalandi dorsalis]|uniref:Protein Mis18-alpha n=1 Tax=Seriola lalandi dorsalis TaxID=1841481 RepID=A0A3B4YI99_SERLL|nr:protein Mis18-alpha isoform X2 [Seriola lalandi dorsalis]XP_056253579.1 protein Mis18-alpha isoform X2 [Seriola aureovittata]XP_056253580.1 protein Mis18-alpha isoform X2 [Seriola aureovittata]